MNFPEWLREWEPKTELACDDICELAAQQHEELASYVCTHNPGPAARRRCSLCTVRQAAKDFQEKYQ